MEQSKKIETKTDKEIVLQIKKGDHDLFSEIVSRYEPKLRRYARKFLFKYNDVDDLVQDVFIKVYINLQSFDDDREFSPWIYRIAHNTYVNALKKKLTDRIFSTDFFDFDTFLPHTGEAERADKESDRELIKKELDHHLDSIDAKYREILILYFYEDMDYKEIAQVLGIPISTVGVRIKRGKDKLKELLSNNNFIYE